MCVHNAKRDDFILKPLALEGRPGAWNPLTGQVEAAPAVTSPSLTAKNAKGRVRITRVSKGSLP